MTAYQPSLARFSESRTNPILSLFARGRRRSDEDAISECLRSIEAFILRHDLRITPATLSLSLDIVSGTNPALVRLIAAREAAGDPITEEWLKLAQATDAAPDGMDELKAIVARIEQSLAEFGQTTKAARSATRDYNCALAEHGRELKRTGEDAPAVKELVQLVAVMLERTRLIEREMARSEERSRDMRADLDRAQRMSEEDYLTGLPNRRAFDKLLTRERALALDADESIIVGFCDLDRFKLINDTHGHEAGDRVLLSVARKLQMVTNDKCHVARHGGEEFAIVFRGLTLEQAFQRLDQARADLAARPLINRDTNVPFGHVTFSAGLCIWPANVAVADVLRAADEALYQAKEGGRNQIVCAR